MSDYDYDLVIVGGGLAGLTAGLFAARHGLHTTVIEHMGAGGQVLNVEHIENWPGLPEGIAGYDLGPIVQEQAEAAGAEFLFDTFETVEADDDIRVVKCAESSYRARSVIIATGSTLRRLGIPGEEQFNGKGVSYCASCDAPFFIDQEVAVVGGGDAAFDEAAVAAGHASKVSLFVRSDEPRAQQALRAKVEEHGSIEVIYNTVVEEILGDDAVSALKLKDAASGETREHPLSGVFVFVGLEPNTASLQGVLDLDSTGHIVTDLMMRTSMPGVFAAGDIRAQSVAQLVSVAGDGATAAIAAYRHLQGRE
jgi:thioredoxin reductase (NADPH)